MDTVLKTKINGLPTATPRSIRRRIERSFAFALERFDEEIETIDVSITNPHSSRRDVTCRVVAHLHRGEPIVVSHRGETVRGAVDGAADCLAEALVRRLGKWRVVRRKTSLAP